MFTTNLQIQVGLQSVSLVSKIGIWK